MSNINLPNWILLKFKIYSDFISWFFWWVKPGVKSTSSQPKNKRGQLQTEYCVAIGWHKLARPPLIGRHRVSRPVIGPQSAEGVHFSATRQRGHLQSERDSAAVRTPSSSPGPGSGPARLPSSSTPAMASRIVKSPHVQVSGDFWRFW